MEPIKHVKFYHMEKSILKVDTQMIASLQISLLLKKVWLLSENTKDHRRNGRSIQLTHQSTSLSSIPYGWIQIFLRGVVGALREGSDPGRISASLYPRFCWWKQKSHMRDPGNQNIYISKDLWFCSILEAQTYLLWKKDYMVLLLETFNHLLKEIFRQLNLYWVSVTRVRIEFLPSLLGKNTYLSISTIDSSSR